MSNFGSGSSSRNHWGAGAALFLLVPITVSGSDMFT